MKRFFFGRYFIISSVRVGFSCGQRQQKIVYISRFNAALDTIEDQDVSLPLELTQTAPRSVTIRPHESTPSTSSAARSHA